jgi:hypothetical protein
VLKNGVYKKVWYQALSNTHFLEFHFFETFTFQACNAKRHLQVVHPDVFSALISSNTSTSKNLQKFSSFSSSNKPPDLNRSSRLRQKSHGHLINNNELKNRDQRDGESREVDHSQVLFNYLNSLTVQDFENEKEKKEEEDRSRKVSFLKKG